MEPDVVAMGMLIVVLVAMLVVASIAPIGGCDRHDDEDPMGEAEERDMRNKKWEGKDDRA